MSHYSFIQRLYDHIQSHYNLEKEELTIVFPNKRAAFYLRSEFKRQYPKTIWLPQMLSIQEAVTQWSKMTLVDNIDMLFELIDIDAELHKEQNSDLSVFGSQAAQMAKDFDEIDQYDTDALHLFHYVLENKKLEIWDFKESKIKEKEQKYLSFFTSLYDYYVRLRERLAAKNQGYYGMITKQLAHMSIEELIRNIGNRKVIFAGFNALTTTEERIIDRLVKNGCAEVIFDYDSHYVNNPDNEAGLFARRYLESHPDWMKNGILECLSKEEKTLHIVKASGNTLQAKALQKQLQDHKEANTAIILADEALLVPVLNAIPDNCGYDELKVSMGYPITKTPVNQLIKAYFNLHHRSKISRKITEQGIEHTVEGWYIWPVLKIMDLEIVKIIFTPKEIAEFNAWKAPRVKKGKFIFEDNDLADFSQIPELQKFLELALKNIPTTDTDIPKATIDNLIQLLRFIAIKIQSRNEDKKLLFLLNQVSEVGKTLNRIAAVVERHANYVHDLKSVEILYKLLSSNSTIKLNSSSTEGLQIMGLLETRNIDFRRLHLLSVNEGILPTDKAQGSFIPNFIKKECGLPGYNEKQAVFAYHFYRLLQNGDDIYLYYNSLGDALGGEPSRYILQIRHELKPYSNITIKEEEFESDTSSTMQKLELNVQKTNCIDKIKHYISTAGISPTSLSTYISCPLKFYLKKIMGIEDSSLDEEIGSNVIGTITHSTLQFLFEDYRPKNGVQQVIDKELFDKVIMPQWEAMLEKAIKENMPFGFTDVGFNFLNKTIIQQQLENYLKFVSEQLKEHDLIVLETEGKLKATLSTPVGDCLFSGHADHIDLWGNTYRVIDYKTGSVHVSDLKVPVRKEEDTDIDFLKSIPEKALQLLIYKYLYIREHQIHPEQVTAEIHGLRYSNTIVFGLSQTPPKKNEEFVPCLDDDNFIADMEALLTAFVTELLDPEIPFVQAEKDDKCEYCEFRVMCKR